MEDSLFGDLDEFTFWKKEWVGMPEYKQEDLEPAFQIEVHFYLKDINGKPELKFGATQIIKVNFEDIESIQKFSEVLELKGINCETNACCYIEGIEKFSQLINQNITKETNSIWYPEVEIDKVSNLRWIDKEKTN